MLCYCMLLSCFLSFFIFFFNDTAPTEIYTLFPTRRSSDLSLPSWVVHRIGTVSIAPRRNPISAARSEEHTSELQSRRDLVCRLLLEKHVKTNDRTGLVQTTYAECQVDACVSRPRYQVGQPLDFFLVVGGHPMFTPFPSTESYR